MTDLTSPDGPPTSAAGPPGRASTQAGSRPARTTPGATARALYRGLAHLVILAVVVQAAMIAWTMFGLGEWVQDGGVLDAGVLADRDTVNFTAQRGAMVHGLVGVLVVPGLALTLLVVSFFARIPGGVRRAGAVVLLVVAQVALGFAGHGAPWVGLLHAVNAFLIIGVARAADGRAAVTSAAEGALG